MTHVGDGKLQIPSCFRLDNILGVPDLASNLLSIHTNFVYKIMLFAILMPISS